MIQLLIQMASKISFTPKAGLEMLVLWLAAAAE